MTELNEIREVILEAVVEHLALDDASLGKLRASGRLDEFTAVDSLLMVELVLMLEERFDMRFAPEHIDADLISDLNRLATFVSETQSDT